jgi:glycosyltransferase involved in cell wall biosynthesis
VNVSVVVPTRNRRNRLLALLGNLERSTHPIVDVVVVDSSDEPLAETDCARFPGLRLEYVATKVRSVCAQRNAGIRRAQGSWVFLCDDDMEVPSNYLARIADHVLAHPEAGAVSGLVLEEQGGRWRSEHPVTSRLGLLWRYVFQLGVWGPIEVRGPIVDLIAERYRRRGNHISCAGWPVLVDFSGEYFRTPLYTLGASVVRKHWLLGSPYDERLDPHGLGDNYGVAIGFPREGIHILTGLAVLHHKEQSNRLHDDEAYARRLLALHYFIKSRAELTYTSEGAFIWSLFGQVAFHAMTGNRRFTRAAWATLRTVLRGKNPYLAPHGAGN